MSTIDFDIVIIGGGPAGLIAAKQIISESTDYSVLLLEESAHYSDVIKCGEGVWKKPFEELITPRPEWVRLNITKASFHAPNNTEVIFRDQGKVLGYILDRVRFQEELLSELSESITVKRSIRAVSVTPDSSNQTVILSSDEKITAKLVIDASGPFSRLGVDNGVGKSNTELEPALYAIVKGVKQESDTVHLQMSSKWSPGGYVWLFPVSDDVVNVGVVCGKDSLPEKSLREMVQEYIDTYLSEGEIVSWHGGAIPSFTKYKNLVAPGFIQCGDAGGLVNPITRSGISESMLSGKLAGETAVKVLESTDNGKKALLAYKKRLYKEYSSTMEKLAKVKASLYKISDDDFNAAADKLCSIPEEKRTMLKILQTTITKSPKLLFAMRYLL